MAPKKGGGKSKGKQPSKKTLLKGPAIELSESEDEGDIEDQQVILEQLVALKQAQGLLLGGPISLGKWATGHITRKVSQKQSQAQVHNCLICLSLRASQLEMTMEGWLRIRREVRFPELSLRLLEGVQLHLLLVQI